MIFSKYREPFKVFGILGKNPACVNCEFLKVFHVVGEWRVIYCEIHEREILDPFHDVCPHFHFYKGFVRKKLYSIWVWFYKLFKKKRRGFLKRWRRIRELAIAVMRDP